MTRLSDFLFALPPLPPCPGRCPPMTGSWLLLGNTPGGLALRVAAAWSGGSQDCVLGWMSAAERWLWCHCVRTRRLCASGSRMRCRSGLLRPPWLAPQRSGPLRIRRSRVQVRPTLGLDMHFWVGLCISPVSTIAPQEMTVMARRVGCRSAWRPYPSRVTMFAWFLSSGSIPRHLLCAGLFNRPKSRSSRGSVPLGSRVSWRLQYADSACTALTQRTMLYKNTVHEQRKTRRTLQQGTHKRRGDPRVN